MLQNSIESNAYALHARLAKHNVLRTNIATPSVAWEDDEHAALENRLLEGRYLEGLRSSIKSLTPEPINSADDFIQWFEGLAECGPGQNHMLFDWLERDANLDELKWFLTQEMVGDLGFEDLVAYTQIKLPAAAKLECARNFWDEMGRGKQGATHSLLLGRVIHGLKLQPSIDTALWESLARNNVMLGLATNRRYAYHSLGALGASELTSVARAAKISACMSRLGLEPWIRSYFDLQIALDVSHSRCWVREVIRPLIIANPECAPFIAEGALMRLQSDQLCFDRYSYELGLNDETILEENEVLPLFFHGLSSNEANVLNMNAA